ncbi:hypothetical protein HS048_01800 [Planomonospora sp. ID91781]|uniref:MgtC/SapB family protein n=1 Tax=Planomonospora sp. ID91781 TaxID=2738135 RepID=UPI0018C447D3|nr:MgtC/SapB family protein [Planomonospora sp. ID91781]MBG0819496.1 hypothetical protein [Planomonospora sp. ID91781]
MSSGTPEGPSPNPDDWKSPYSTGPGRTSGYGGQPSGHDPHRQGHGTPHDPYGRTAHGQGHGSQAYGSPGYDPGHGSQPYDPGYGAQDYGAQDYGTQGYGATAYDPGYGAPGYASPGYASPGYASPGYGGPYGPRPQQNVDGVRTHAIVALVISIVLAMSCYVSLGGLIGAILSGIALSKVEADTAYARKLLKWTWISIGTNFGLLLLGLVALFVAAASGSL